MTMTAEDISKFHGQTILVVDDEQQVCDVLASALSLLGYQVRTACDGLDAVEKLEGRDFSIVITDMDMPRMDGMGLIRHLAENRADIDIIAITGHMMKYRYTDVVAAGSADFIAKPFTMDELEAKLERIVRERRLRQELERLADRDPLTGLYNRRAFQSVLRKEAVRAVRYDHPLHLFFADIDRFKEYNDNMGHQAGDDLLIAFAGLLKSVIRQDVDTAFRYGGDEFTAVLPHLPREQALSVAERIRESYAGLGFTPTTLSIGVARFRSLTGDMDKDVDDLIHRADMALYHAKNDLGRNRVHLDEESLD